MKRLILIFAVMVFSLVFTSCERKDKEDFKRINLEEYKEYVYVNGGIEPLMIIWWQEVTNPYMKSVEHPFKKFCIASELRTIMKEFDGLSHNKKTRSTIHTPGENNVLRIYFESRHQNQFRILEIEFTLDPNSNEFVSNYGSSAKLYELLSLKEESENYGGIRDSNITDSNEYQEHLKKVREFGRSRKADANQQKP